MDLQARAQQNYGVDWAYMKQKYEAHAVIAKLTELLERAAERRLSITTPMANLGADMDAHRFENQLLTAISPNSGISTLYAAVSRLISSAIPLVARQPDRPMTESAEGVWVGVYWSRALASAVAVGLASTNIVQNDDNEAPVALDAFVPAGVTPDLIERVRERNVLGWVWELPGLDRSEFGE